MNHAKKSWVKKDASGHFTICCQNVSHRIIHLPTSRHIFKQYSTYSVLHKIQLKLNDDTIERLANVITFVDSTLKQDNFHLYMPNSCAFAGVQQNNFSSTLKNYTKVDNKWYMSDDQFDTIHIENNGDVGFLDNE